MKLTRETNHQEKTLALMRQLMLRSQRDHMRDPIYNMVASRRFKNLQGENISATDTFTADASGKYRLGTRGYTTDGRIFHYCRIGAVAAVPGSLYQSSVAVAGNLAQTPAAASQFATAVTITAITTTVTANQYAEGLLNIESTPGQGVQYAIASHPAVTGGSPLTLQLYPDEQLQIALTTGTRVGLIANPYADLIITPTTQTALCVGWPSVAAGIAAFCWLQTWGPVSALINGTPAITAPVANSATTIGAVDAWVTAAATVAVQTVGHMMQVGVSTKNDAVFAQLQG